MWDRLLKGEFLSIDTKARVLDARRRWVHCLSSAYKIMPNQPDKAGTTDTPFRQQPLSLNVDLRCATILAKVALQTLADLSPEAASAIDNALGHEIGVASERKDPETLAVIALLTDLRAQLFGENVLSNSEDNAWYMA